MYISEGYSAFVMDHSLSFKNAQLSFSKEIVFSIFSSLLSRSLETKQKTNSKTR